MAVATLLLAVTLVALAARRTGAPYTVLLVAAGVILAAAGALPFDALPAPVLFTWLLPPLLFDAARHVRRHELCANKWILFALTVPGVLVGTTLVGWTLGALGVLPAGGAVPAGMVLGAIVAATDPVAVVALFREVGAPRRLLVLVEAESLLNDGTAVITLGVVLALAARPPSPVDAALELTRVVALGVGVGVVVGALAARASRLLAEPRLEVVLALAASFGAFAIGEHLHASGILAVVAAGVIWGDVIPVRDAEHHRRVGSMWDTIAFGLNSAVFLWMCGGLDAPALVRAAGPIALTWLVITLTRGLLITLTAAAVSRTRERLPTSYLAVLTWGGLRGALSIALATSLPASVPARSQVVTLVFGVVLVGILVQGATAKALLSRAGLVEKA